MTHNEHRQAVPGRAFNWLEILAERLERLGMPMQGERLERTARLGLLYSKAPHELHDLLLMGIAVEAEHRADADAPIWV